jgi:hypothetical protein
MKRPAMRWFKGRTIDALCVAPLLAADVARAADEDSETLIQQAVEPRRKGEHTRAYRYLKRAYDLARTPRSAAQLGLVEHARGPYSDAEVLLGEALATSDPWVGQNRPRLESSRNFVRSKLGRVEIVGARRGNGPLSGQPDVVGVVLLQYGAGVHARDRRRRPDGRGTLPRGGGA